MKKILIMVLISVMIMASCTGPDDNEKEQTDKTINVIDEQAIESENIDLHESSETNVTISLPEALEYEEVTHVRNEVYGRTFDMLFHQTEDISVGFLVGLYEQDQLDDIVRSIEADYNDIYETLRVGHDKITIYVLDQTIAGGAYIVDNSVFCSQDDIENQRYRTPLVQATLNIEQAWILEGLRGYIYEEIETTEVLKMFYEESQDISLLGLNGPRFYQAFTTEEELMMARLTATSLVSYVIENYDYTTLLLRFEPEMKNEWLESIGVDRTYFNEYDEVLSDVEYAIPANYDLYAISGNDRYYISRVDRWIESAKDVETFIYNTIMAKDFYIDSFTPYAVDHPDRIDLEFSYVYYLDNEVSSSLSSDGVFKLSNLDTSMFRHPGEMIAVFLSSEGISNHWQFSGFKDLMGEILCPYSNARIRVLNYYQALKQMREDQEEMLYLDELILTYMDTRGGNYVSTQDMDIRTYYDAMAYISLFLDYGVESEYMNVPIYQYMEIDRFQRIDGDELTYAQATSFTIFLYDRYGLETLLDFCFAGENFDVIFGRNYEDLKAEWLEFLTS